MNSYKFHKTKLFFGTIGTIVLIILALFAISNIVDQITHYNASFFGLRSSVVISESMGSVNEVNTDKNYTDKGALHRGDLVFTFEYKDFEDVKIGDIITYYNGNSLVCHRVVDKVIRDDKDYVITMGDANNTNDGLIPFSEVKGKMIFYIPKIGYVSLYLKSNYGLLAISLIIFIIVVSLIINEIIKHKEEIKNSNKESNETIYLK